LKAGDESARKELLNCACERLARLTRKMLKAYPRACPTWQGWPVVSMRY
jgi:hypothetical protein